MRTAVQAGVGCARECMRVALVCGGGGRQQCAESPGPSPFTAAAGDSDVERGLDLLAGASVGLESVIHLGPSVTKLRAKASSSIDRRRKGNVCSCLSTSACCLTALTGGCVVAQMSTHQNLDAGLRLRVPGTLCREAFE